MDIKQNSILFNQNGEALQSDGQQVVSHNPVHFTASFWTLFKFGVTFVKSEYYIIFFCSSCFSFYFLALPIIIIIIRLCYYFIFLYSMIQYVALFFCSKIIIKYFLFFHHHAFFFFFFFFWIRAYRPQTTALKFWDCWIR